MRFLGGALHGGAPIAPRYNIAPTQDVPVVTQTAAGARCLYHAPWGLVPPWQKPGTPKPINVRSETAADSRWFGRLLRRQRCLLPADGFIEWRSDATGKTPIRFTLADGALFAFAGVYEEGAPDEHGWREKTVAILTSSPNELCAPVHNRMPCIVPRQYEDLWLDATVEDPATWAPVLQPYPAELMRAYAVSRRVNNPRNDDPACTTPLA